MVPPPSHTVIDRQQSRLKSAFLESVGGAGEKVQKGRTSPKTVLANDEVDKPEERVGREPVPVFEVPNFFFLGGSVIRWRWVHHLNTLPRMS
ncbi:hypothetical protein CSOJ01_10087 [Colletotrichum sojae]|uniref:Uncharacterized protein n=1 Tax=Colletotrichum sojae TaxID=2175907 RepID=A0A8H6MPQ4_9PEZI|nr:hypothetical protein CSOJ01_10087 [Colletotrichum sojae]